MGLPAVVAVVTLMVLQHVIQISECQQSYVNNKQLDCNQNYTETEGYECNGAATTCTSYLTFRSNPIYNSPATIGFLLSADPTSIFLSNRNRNLSSSDVSPIPSDHSLVVVPVNCSCSASGSQQQQRYYQHNASYALKTESETYFTVANNTYQGLTTCQSLIAQNPTLNFRQLEVDMRLTVPLRCACPTRNQSAAGVKYLLSYLVTWRDSISSIADAFGGVDVQAIYSANRISPDNLIFPFTPLLVPLTTEPTNILINSTTTTTTNPTPPPPPPPIGSPSVPAADTNKWLFVGVGLGAAALFLLLVGFLVWFLIHRRRSRRHQPPPPPGPILPPPILKRFDPDYSALTTVSEEDGTSKSLSVYSKGVRDAIEHLTIYKFEDLEKATGNFSEANRVKQGSSLYQGWFKGDQAAVKIMRGDVSAEINILKQINHSNIIRLSGFCVHQGNTYLVYEFAEKGSLSDWLQPQHLSNKTAATPVLGWRQRVQIAYDVADALNYLHKYASPPYIHKNLKASNILLDANFRAKIANFGLARTFFENPTAHEEGGEEEEGLQQLQVTRHVVGTYGYMAPEYIENGLVTPKLDVFSFGVVMLELLSAREAGTSNGDKQLHGVDSDKKLLSTTINEVLGGDNVREKLKSFMDPRLKNEYPLDSAHSMAQLAKNCVVPDLNSRPPMSEVLVALSKILSSSLDWDPSDEFDRSTSIALGR